MVDIKNLDTIKIKIIKKSCKNILIYCVGYMTPNNVKSLYLIINKEIGYIGKNNLNKYLTVVSADETKDTLRKYRMESEIILDQQAINQMTMIRNTRK